MFGLSIKASGATVLCYGDPITVDDYEGLYPNGKLTYQPVIRRYDVFMSLEWIEMHRQMEGVELQHFRTEDEVTQYIRYANGHVKCDLIDMTFVTPTLEATYADLVKQVNHVFSEVVKPRRYTHDGVVRTNYYDEKKVIGLTLSSEGIRVFGVGEYAHVLRDLLMKSFKMPQSLASSMTAATGTFTDKLLREVSIPVKQPIPALFSKERPTYTRLHRMDVCLDVVSTDWDYDSIVAVCMTARSKMSGKRLSVLELGDEEYGRSTYLGKSSGGKQWCIYEKNKQTHKKHHQAVHTRIEFRYRPKRTKNFRPEMASLLSPAEVFFQSKLGMHIIRDIKNGIK